MYHIIANPIAGRGRTLNKLPLLSRLFDAKNLPHKILVTDCVMDAYQKAKAACNEGSQGIIGIGGDGTIQEIVAGMAAASNGPIAIPLGIFPGGSGNDFVMTLAGGKKEALKRYKKRNHEASATAFVEAVAANSTTPVDLIKVGGMAYLNIGNIGLDAHVVKNAIAHKQSFGRYAYIAAVYQSIARHRNMPLTIELDGVVQEGAYTLVAVCNGQYYGGGLHLAPDARLDDGKITVCMVKAMSRPRTMVIFPYLMLGRHHRLRAVSFHKCTDIKIRLKSGIEYLSLDGNLYGISGGNEHQYVSPHQLEGADKGEMHFTVIPQAINIFV